MQDSSFEAEAHLFIDFDDTDRYLRVWQGARLVGEMRPDLKAAPEEAADMRWTGWLSSSVVVEIIGAYKQFVPEPVDG